jgi:uncharacterized RDD family membrane protein YckC
MPENSISPLPPTPEPSPAFNYAMWADRVIAALIDGALIVVVTVVLYFVVTAVSTAIGLAGSSLSKGNQNGSGAVGCLSSGICCLLFILLPIVTFGIGMYNKVYLVGKRGYSVGQGIMKLEVIDKNGNRPSKSTLIIRLLAQIGLGLVPLVGQFLDLLWPLWDPQRQTLHDKAVGTFVIKKT